MAAPNLISLTSVKIDTALQIATTSLADVTFPIAAAAAVPSGHAYQIDALFCANYHASIRAKITIVHKKGGTEYKIVPLLSIPVGQTLNAILGKPIYMAEGDTLRILCDTSSAVLVAAPYSDAAA